MLERSATRFNSGDWFLMEIDTEVPDCTVSGFLDGAPVNFYGDVETGIIIGGRINWNQQLQRTVITTGGSSASANGNCRATRCTPSFDAETNIYTLTALENTGNSGFIFNKNSYGAPLVATHKYLVTATIKATKNFNFAIGANNAQKIIGPLIQGEWHKVAIITEFASNSNEIRFNFNSNNEWASSDIAYITDFMCIDLTDEFGEAFADGMFSADENETGAGAAAVKSIFLPADYYDYEIGTEKSITYR